MRYVIRTRHQLTFQGFVVATALAATGLVFAPLLDATGLPLTSILTGSIGLLLQALPFLIIGVLLSSAIETFLTQTFLERHFPRNPLAGMAIALAAGFCMPICDCATVPVFARMLHKHVPLSSAVVFLCAAPIINPVVIWSTWFAFPDKPLITALRVAMGIVVALIMGTTMLMVPERETVLREDAFDPDGTMATSHHLENHEAGDAGRADSSEDDRDVAVAAPPFTSTPVTATHSITALERFTAYLRHAHDDLFHIVPYMLAGVVLASTIRVLSGSHPPTWLTGHGQILSIVIMMLLAFVSSLCSTSDAVIARGLVSLFPTSGLLGFLVFGPIMDVKNVLMLLSMCTRRFVIRLGASVAVVCLITMSLLSLALTGLGL